MPKCEECGREFSTDAGFRQHQQDVHKIGKSNSHSSKQSKREERDVQRMNESKRQKNTKLMKNIFIGIICIIAIAGVIYALYYYNNGFVTQKGTYNTTGFPNSFVHWHADVDVFVCGEKQKLPEAQAGGLLGTERLHTHDYPQNIASLPGTDGNGIIHTEGIIPQAPSEHTLEKFMENIGVEFTNESIIDKTNGDLCGQTQGALKVTLNGAPLENFVNYLPRDRDLIRIEFI